MRIKRNKIARTTPILTHLMFANDLILFNSSNEREVELMVNCVNKYCTWLGKQVTLAKLGLFGSKNVSKVTMKFYLWKMGMLSDLFKIQIFKQPPISYLQQIKGFCLFER